MGEVGWHPAGFVKNPFCKDVKLKLHSALRKKKVRKKLTLKSGVISS